LVNQLLAYYNCNRNSNLNWLFL